MLNWLETKLKDKDKEQAAGTGGQKPATSPRLGEHTPEVKSPPVQPSGPKETDDRMKLNDRLVDLVEENKVLKQQTFVLRELEKKNDAELTSLKAELESWKVKAFQMVNDNTEKAEKSVFESPEYRQLETTLEQLRKEKEKLGKQVAELTSRMAEYEKQLIASKQREEAVFDEAEKKYRGEIEDLKKLLQEKEEETKKLKGENTSLAEKLKEGQCTIEVLREQVEGQHNEIQVLSERLSRQASLPSQTRSVTEAHDIDAFRKKFKLPQTEFCIVYYACAFKSAWGHIYISPNFLCFEATFSSTKLVIALVEIKSLHKIKKPLFPGAGTSAEVVLRDGTRHHFSGILQRKAALMDIYRQMVKSNIPVKTYRDGKEETYKLE